MKARLQRFNYQITKQTGIFSPYKILELAKVKYLFTRNVLAN